MTSRLIIGCAGKGFPLYKHNALDEHGRPLPGTLLNWKNMPLGKRSNILHWMRQGETYEAAVERVNAELKLCKAEEKLRKAAQWSSISANTTDGSKSDTKSPSARMRSDAPSVGSSTATSILLKQEGPVKRRKF